MYYTFSLLPAPSYVPYQEKNEDAELENAYKQVSSVPPSLFRLSFKVINAMLIIEDNISVKCYW